MQSPRFTRPKRRSTIVRARSNRFRLHDEPRGRKRTLRSYRTALVY